MKKNKIIKGTFKKKTYKNVTIKKGGGTRGGSGKRGSVKQSNIHTLQSTQVQHQGTAAEHTVQNTFKPFSGKSHRLSEQSSTEKLSNEEMKDARLRALYKRTKTPTEAEAGGGPVPTGTGTEKPKPTESTTESTPQKTEDVKTKKQKETKDEEKQTEQELKKGDKVGFGPPPGDPGEPDGGGKPPPRSQGDSMSQGNPPEAGPLTKLFHGVEQLAVHRAIDQSQEIRRAANEEIESLERVMKDQKTQKCLVSGIANVIEKTAPIIIGTFTHKVLEIALYDPEVKLIIYSKIQDMIMDIIRELTPEEIQNIVDNMDNECRISFTRLGV